LVKEIKFYSDARNSLGTSHTFYERKIQHLTQLLDQMDQRHHALKDALSARKSCLTHKDKALYMNDTVVPLMIELRECIDTMEESISAENYPLPTYEQLFTSLN